MNKMDILRLEMDREPKIQLKTQAITQLLNIFTAVNLSIFEIFTLFLTENVIFLKW